MLYTHTPAQNPITLRHRHCILYFTDEEVGSERVSKLPDVTQQSKQQSHFLPLLTPKQSQRWALGGPRPCRISGTEFVGCPHPPPWGWALRVRVSQQQWAQGHVTWMLGTVGICWASPGEVLLLLFTKISNG